MGKTDLTIDICYLTLMHGKIPIVYIQTSKTPIAT
jgi:hypothetical protein